MASPSLPVNIGSPKSRPPNDSIAQSVYSGSGTPATGTPDLRAIRASYAGTPPVPNIPPRGTGGIGAVSAALPLNKAASSVSIAVPTPLRQAAAGQVYGGLSATRQQAQPPAPSPAPTPFPDLDSLPVEEKVQILARHLVPNEQRAKPVGPSDENGGDSRSSKSAAPSIRSQPKNGSEGEVKESLTGVQREDSESFPIPFHTPGADVT